MAQTQAFADNPLHQQATIALAAQVHHPADYGRGMYTVPSRSEPGAWHTVVMKGAGLASCSCMAGQHNRPCVHVAAVFYRLDADADAQDAAIYAGERAAGLTEWADSPAADRWWHAAPVAEEPAPRPRRTATFGEYRDAARPYFQPRRVEL